MIEITREFAFDMAHMLEKYGGKCLNLHGHTYKLFVTVYSIVYGDTDDMIVDFSELNEFVNKLIVDKFDHCYAYKKNSSDIVELGIAKLLEENGRKTMPLPFRPTVEKLTEYIFKSLNFSCVMEDKRFKVKKVRLYETPTSYAECIEEDI